MYETNKMEVIKYACKFASIILECLFLFVKWPWTPLTLRKIYVLDILSTTFIQNNLHFWKIWMLSRQWLQRMASSGMLRRVALVRSDVSEELSASFIRVTRIGELETMLAVTCNRRMLQRNVFAALQASWANQFVVYRGFIKLLQLLRLYISINFNRKWPWTVFRYGFERNGDCYNPQPSGDTKMMGIPNIRPANILCTFIIDFLVS
jgi:hypothetical protein